MAIKKTYAALQLCVQFFCLMVKSGFATLLLIIKLQFKLKKSLQDSYITLEIPHVSETGLVVLSCLISLTPGTSLLDINSENNRLLLHILDAEKTDESVREIKQKFEPYIMTLFAKQPERGKHAAI
ncbi:multicomponent K+:H+ antiporter subunit E [Pasteurella testudinis DSM 23072]|uniref:Multicomponent K+:H+ antiporter subunit E n=1 Tax=Pasteurella testudinis DSM 23072 TaxID=1122938 RepID=A0A1W1ULU1_9PAST|nr:Na+/H+ antiporter subunit E [Pasteurella testudinis]SMB82076.1 multicomponent K+:H+ antiporter subunit E [Pasteurella testudinis DSM 23072]SUB52371.1 Multiple resistance and pH homeostasis protein E [Pasteurella testudinis]